VGGAEATIGGWLQPTNGSRNPPGDALADASVVNTHSRVLDPTRLSPLAIR
jgi:hypothetical protein